MSYKRLEQGTFAWPRIQDGVMRLTRAPETGAASPRSETCKLNNVEPYAYLKATLKAIAQGHRAANIDKLMPWNIDKSS